MSAVTPLPAGDLDRLNDVVMSNVLAELGARRVTQREAAKALGISEQAFSDRVRRRTRITLDDVERFAEMLGLEPFDLLVPRRTRMGSAELPRLDSNQKPSGYWYETSRAAEAQGAEVVWLDDERARRRSDRHEAVSA